MVQTRDRYEKVVAMTILSSNMDGAAIFNPLVDAPPEPPPLPLSSYQHTPDHFATSSSPTGDIPNEPNYYYSSSINVVSPPFSKLQEHGRQQQEQQYSHSMMDEEEWQQPQERRRDRQKHSRSCRILLFMGFLYILVFSWKKCWHYYHEEHPSTTTWSMITMKFGNHLLEKSNTDDLVDHST